LESDASAQGKSECLMTLQINNALITGASRIGKATVAFAKLELM